MFSANKHSLEKNVSTKSDIFELGLTVLKISIREDAEIITYLDKHGHEQVLIEGEE